MIYCVWYPSGGFGHFINAILTLHGENFVRPDNTLEFSPRGNSHSLNLVTPKYFHEFWPEGVEFLDDKNYCILVDNGIDNKSESFKLIFPNSTIIKICYSNYSWPVVARTLIEKAMLSSMDQELPLDQWNTDEPWARREKYFLYLKDHSFRYAWRPSAGNQQSNHEIDIRELYNNYNECYTVLNAVVAIEDFRNLWNAWRIANSKYIDPVITALKVLSNVVSNQPENLSHITDIWTQSVIYYYIWVRFQIEVPHNEFANFFADTREIRKLVL